MDIKSKSHILKKRAKELGYDIKLTHAQEIVSAIYGHQSRHSALIEDSLKEAFKEGVKSPDLIRQVNNKENLKSYLNDAPLSEDNFLLAEQAFNVGILLGKEFGKPLSEKLDKISEDYHQEDVLKKRIFNRALYHGVLKCLTSALDIQPMRDYFKDLEEREYVSPIGGLREVQKVLKKRTKEMWEKLKEKY